MSIRFSGTLRLEISYSRVTDSYSVDIDEMNGDAVFQSQTGIKLPPRFSGLTRTSKKAIDQVANAALWFASNTDSAVDIFARRDFDGFNFQVRHLALVG